MNPKIWLLKESSHRRCRQREEDLRAACQRYKAEIAALEQQNQQLVEKLAKMNRVIHGVEHD